MSARLQNVLESLYGLERGKEKLGLEGITLLLDALGHPERTFRSVHVAGTNGKGSTCALIERVLRATGIRTGLFTSPHLVSFRERMRVNGRWADEDRLEARIEYLRTLPVSEGRTFFEMCTALAFDDFAHRRVEWAVVEVGLGGRLDCTNVLTPNVSVITSIGLEHTQILGASVEAIAAEKAGIVKAGVPVVLGAMPESARQVIAAIAADRGAPLVATHLEGAPSDVSAVPMMQRNRATARAVLRVLRDGGLEISADAERHGFAAARWPGRLERCPGDPGLWWDGAHNVEAAEALAATVGVPRFAALVLAVSRHKDLEAMLDSFERIVIVKRLVATRSRNPRAAEIESVAATARSKGWEVECVADVASACRRARQWVRNDVLLTGSLFAIAEAMEAFGGAPEGMQ